MEPTKEYIATRDFQSILSFLSIKKGDIYKCSKIEFPYCDYHIENIYTGAVGKIKENEAKLVFVEVTKVSNILYNFRKFKPSIRS